MAPGCQWEVKLRDWSRCARIQISHTLGMVITPWTRSPWNGYINPIRLNEFIPLTVGNQNGENLTPTWIPSTVYALEISHEIPNIWRFDGFVSREILPKYFPHRIYICMVSKFRSLFQSAETWSWGSAWFASSTFLLGNVRSGVKTSSVVVFFKCFVLNCYPQTLGCFRESNLTHIFWSN